MTYRLWYNGGNWKGVEKAVLNQITQFDKDVERLIEHSPGRANKIHQLGYDDIKKCEQSLKAIERPEYIEQMKNVYKVSDFLGVVRCSECKHRDKIECPLCYQEEWHVERFVSEDFAGGDNWFCANGEKDE